MDIKVRLHNRIENLHVLLAAHILVSIALHTFINGLVQQDFPKTYTIRPRNETFRRCRQGTACGVGTGGRKEEAEAKRD